MTNLYIDTNIIVDAVEGRKNIFGKNIGNPASDLFFQSISCKYHLIISDWTLQELSDIGKLDSTKLFFEMIKKKIVPANFTIEEKAAAKIRSENHDDDALHIIIAEREKADFIVTRNTDHFLEIGTTISLKIPEHLI